MLDLYLKYFTILFSSLYIYLRLLNVKVKSIRFLFDFVSTLIFSVVICYIRPNYPTVSTLVLIFFFFAYTSLTFKIEPELALTTTILSISISFFLYTISTLFVATIFNHFKILYSDNFNVIFIVCICIVEILLSTLPWKFKRLKSGMPFLKSHGTESLGVIISSFLLCCLLFLNDENKNSLNLKMPITLIALCGMLIFFWWRSKLKRSYLDILRTREIEDLKSTIHVNEDQIEYLKQHNDYLSKIVHKDNKLIPAMELAVKEYLQSSECNMSMQLNGTNLLEELRSISSERSKIIEDYQCDNDNLPLTGIFQIDTLMKYMLGKAKKCGIKFDVTVSGSIKYMVENIISMPDLRTLMADLIENAIIATKSCKAKEIMVSLGVLDKDYTIDIYDSGIPFNREVISNFGHKRTTTHADTGGSGIGLMTIFEILNSYHASFAIEEYSEKSGGFTKKVSVIFDTLHQFKVKLKNDADFSPLIKRTGEHEVTQKN